MPAQPKRHTAAALCACSIVALAGVGCSDIVGNPFDTRESEYGTQVPLERLRTVDRFAIDDYQRDGAVQQRPDEVDIPREIPQAFADKDTFDLTLEQCRAWTLSNNLDLQVRLIDPVIAERAISEEEAQFEATFFTNARITSTDTPTATTLSGSNNEFTNINPGVRVPLRTGGTVTIDLPIDRTRTDNQFTFLNPAYETDFRVSLSHNLLRGAGRRANTHGIRIASLESQIVQAQTKLEIIRQLAAVDRAYWRLYAAQRNLEVQYEQYNLALEQLERAERRVRAAVAPEIEIVRAEEGVATRLNDIIGAVNQVRRTQRDLKRIINVDGLDVDSDVFLVLTSEPDPVSYALEAGPLVQTALDTRMEMLELELRVAQDLSTIDFEKNRALPLLAFDYTYTINGLGGSLTDSLDVLNENNFEDWSLGLNFEVPLGNEAAEARVHRAILRRLQRLATREARAQAISQEVLNALDQLQTAWQAIVASRQSVLLAARTLRAEENQFDVGNRTSTDVLDASARLADAQQREIAALAEYQISQVDLAFATGTLLGAARVDWDPNDPRTHEDFYGDRLQGDVQGDSDGSYRPSTPAPQPEPVMNNELGNLPEPSEASG